MMWTQKGSLAINLKDTLLWFFFFLNKDYFGCKLLEVRGEGYGDGSWAVAGRWDGWLQLQGTRLWVGIGYNVFEL